MTRDFFDFLKNQDKNQSYWLAPGSGQFVWKGSNFQNKAATAYDNALLAISYEVEKRPNAADIFWKEIYGSKF